MTLSPHISEQFSGAIWRMEIDELSEILFVEIRNNEEKKVQFAALDLNTGLTLLKNLDTPERWLTGIEAAHNGVLLLHYYQSETGPTHKGLMAVDAMTTETLWSNYSYSFDHLSVNGPVLYDARVQPRKLFLADIKTGATTRIYEPSVYMDMKNSVIVPAVITEELLPYGLLSIHPYGNMIHYLEYNNFRIVSLHALKAGQLFQAIYIFDGVNRVYEDLLNTDIQKMQPEAFILHKNRLIYIKNTTELKVLAL
ncbi:DUF4905 domain-containing protein [Mucilaginibacter sp.]|uniref:DUF4905 domain-containing protein n=1 Tax=Mucilaginibacter sp. TaxID=1882438 RepID=UPI003D09D97E